VKEQFDMTSPAPFSLSRRRSVFISSQDVAKVSHGSNLLPLLIAACRPNVDLAAWARANLTLIADGLLRHGAILFRGFAVNRPELFQEFVRVISGEPLHYNEQTSPRTQVAEKLYTSTDYPSDQSILFHNENSYAVTFPRKLFFWCDVPAREGGQTPLADTRRVLEDIDRSVLDRFIRFGWMYVRNFSAHFGLSWQTAFRTESRREVEDYCRKAVIDYEWTESGLRTRQIRPSTIRHPVSSETVWFNHATFFHVSNIEPILRAQLLAQYGEAELPNNTYYGDGAPIEDCVIEHLRQAYEKEAVSFQWEPGDVALIDNVLTAHSRTPFVDPRRILFSMAEPYTRADLQ
jgi:alpha-ketoglutarate-dependent taurine dioxygenase